MRRHLGLPLVLLFAVLGCNSEPTESDVESWIRTQDYVKLNELIAGSEHKMDIRVRAVELLLQGGQNAPVQSAMKAAPDKDALAGALADKLVQSLQKEGADLKEQIAAKDALFGCITYLDAKRQDEVLKAIAGWAFEGLTEKSDQAALIKRLSETDMSIHLTMLRQYGVQVASWLVSSGIETRRLIPYLHEAKDRASQRMVLAAVRKLFAMKNLVIPWEILDAVHAYALPETIDFLFDVYMTDRFGGDAQSSAFRAAQNLIYGKVEGVNIAATSEDKKVVLAALRKLQEIARATDRWDAADMIIRVGGVGELSMVLDGFKDNLPSYARYTPDGDIELPDYAINEFCTEKLKPSMATARPILEARLSSDDRVQKAFSILCLKVFAEPASIDKLQPLTKETNTSLEDFFFVKEERERRKPLIISSEIPELTVGLLAQNAVDGITLLGELEKDKAAGTLSADDYKLRTESVMAVIHAAGEAFRPAVKQVYAKKSKTPWDPAPPPAPAPPEKKK